MNELPKESVNKLTNGLIKFLGLIAKPAAKELGFLLEDKMRSWRIQNQVDILIKTHKYVESKGINIKSIPMKILVPLLDYSSLEEEEELQDLWSILLANMLNANENFQNHIFPYILSQMSIEDYKELLNLEESEKKFKSKQSELVEVGIKERARMDAALLEGTTLFPSSEYRDLYKTITEMEQRGFNMDFLERDNLERLKLARQVPPRIIIDEVEVGGLEFEPKFGRSKLPKETIQISAQYDIYDYGYRMTDLGFEFLKACKIEN